MSPKPATPKTLGWEVIVAALVLATMVGLLIKFRAVDRPPEVPTPAAGVPSAGEAAVPSAPDRTQPQPDPVDVE